MPEAKVKELTARQWANLDAWCRAHRLFIEGAATRQEVFDKALKKSQDRLTGRRRNECKCGVAQPEHIIIMCESQRIRLPES